MDKGKIFKSNIIAIYANLFEKDNIAAKNNIIAPTNNKIIPPIAQKS